MSALLELQSLTVDFQIEGGAFRGTLGSPPVVVRAVDGVDLTLAAGEALGLVGESGSGKSTLARTIVGLTRPTTGQIVIEGEAVGERRSRERRRRAQMVFQDPTASLNPALSVRRALAEPIISHGLASGKMLEARLRELVAMVELPASILPAHPRQLSGGQRQRVAIARALALEPELLVADEPVAALDVSVQASVINLLARLRRELGLTILFISHDLAVVRQLCDRVAVMYLGSIVEEGPTTALLSSPEHPYTRALLAAAPRLGSRNGRSRQRLIGEPPGALTTPPGCRFHPRCPIAEQNPCASVEPQLRGSGGHVAACHFAWQHDDE